MYVARLPDTGSAAILLKGWNGIIRRGRRGRAVLLNCGGSNIWDEIVVVSHTVQAIFISRGRRGHLFALSLSQLSFERSLSLRQALCKKMVCLKAATIASLIALLTFWAGLSGNPECHLHQIHQFSHPSCGLSCFQSILPPLIYSLLSPSTTNK